ncbi:MAG: cytoplasmic protein [Lachnospiraceae bacterium]|jgi:hypothetical protein|nr:cytoplasmic protein [Lachnospiraceae bacterium]
MENSKMYSYTYEEHENEDKGAHTMVADILADPSFPDQTELIIGSWGWACEDSCQPILDGIIQHAEEFSHIKKLFIGDMDFEECEVSWIIQGDYSKLWEAMPGLKELTIKGSCELRLGQICHEGLESLTIICGGLPTGVFREIQEAKLPNLKKLLLYVGIENYGFNGDADTIRTLLEKGDFPKLEYLGIADSEIQDELAKVVLESKFMGQLHTLDLSCGTLTDKGGEALLEALPSYPNIKVLDLHYHYLSDSMMEKLKKLPVELNVDEQNEADVYRGEIWMNAMLTE